jgi:hypothetical protein
LGKLKAFFYSAFKAVFVRKTDIETHQKFLFALFLGVKDAENDLSEFKRSKGK